MFVDLRPSPSPSQENSWLDIHGTYYLSEPIPLLLLSQALRKKAKKAKVWKHLKKSEVSKRGPPWIQKMVSGGWGVQQWGMRDYFTISVGTSSDLLKGLWNVWGTIHNPSAPLWIKMSLRKKGFITKIFAVASSTWSILMRFNLSVSRKLAVNSGDLPSERRLPIMNWAEQSVFDAAHPTLEWKQER